MKRSMLAIWIVFAVGGLRAQTTEWQPSPGHTQIPIWPGTAPDAQPATGSEKTVTDNKELVAGRPWVYVTNVSKPTMTVYSPTGGNTGVAVVVFPGGGYQGLAIDLEGTEVCDWLTSKGITCVLLKYRVPPDDGYPKPAYPKSGPYPESPLALEDAQRTMRLVRLHAAEWHIDPHKVGVLGFSAGVTWWRPSALTIGNACIRRSMPPTKKAVDQILPWRCIQGICRFPRRNGMRRRAPKSIRFPTRRMRIEN